MQAEKGLYISSSLNEAADQPSREMKQTKRIIKGAYCIPPTDGARVYSLLRRGSPRSDRGMNSSTKKSPN